MKTKGKKLSESKSPLKKLKKATIGKTKNVKELTKKGVKEATKKKLKPIKKSASAEDETKKKLTGKKPLIKESKFKPFTEMKMISSENQEDKDKKKKKNKRHRKNKSTGFKTMTKSLNKNVKTLEAAEKLAEKKLENLKELRAKRKNKLFVACKKKVTGQAQIKALHPGIKSVIFPRKKNTIKYCWISFETPKKALEAFETLKNEKDYSIQKPRTNVNNIDVKTKAKELLEKSQKKMKKKAIAASFS